MQRLKSAMPFLFVVGVWWLAAEYSIATPYFLPSPRLVLGSFQESMLLGALATTARAVAGFALGIFTAYALFGLLYSAGAVAGAEDQFSAARSVPIIAATPLFILWFGFGEPARFLVVVLTVIAFVIGPLAEGVKSIPREVSIIRERLGKSKSWEFLNVLLPGTLPSMIGPLRVVLAIAFTTAVAVEFMGSTIGIGRAIDSARVTFNTPAIFLLLIISGAIGIVLDRCLRALLGWICHWRDRTNKG